MKPQASVKKREITRINRNIRSDNHPKGVPEHVGTDYIRSAHCEKHPKGRSKFDGVVADGWVFICEWEGLRHTFLAEPAP